MRPIIGVFSALGNRRGVFYVYDGSVNIVRAAEADIELSGEIVTSKVIVNTVKYYYDTEGKIIKKVITFSDNSTHTVHYENSDDNTVVKFDVPDTENVNKKQTVTSHSKTDSFGRKVFDELQIGRGFVSRQFSYIPGAITDEHKKQHLIKSTATTQLVSQIALSDGRTISYEYDDEERIIKVTDTIDGTVSYTYDALGQLLTETVNGEVVNSMEYDNYGNITKKNDKVYTYGETKWKDLLTGFDGKTIEYDAQGNPVKYLDHTLTWEKGRQLKSFDGNTYSYNANGIRTSKKVNGVLHTYTLDGTKILRETWDGNTLIPLYDNEDGVCGILYNNIPYYFVKNLQGDVIAIVDKDAQTVARYSYDAWGKVVSVTDKDGTDLSDNASHIANINPFRYRGYYYDEEIDLYYLQSRYYDASVGRFISSDDIRVISIFPILQTQNIYMYCANDCVNNCDPTGYLTWPGAVHAHVQRVLAIYIWSYLKCFTYIDYFIRFSMFKYGFADLYAKDWNEIWEVKPNKSKYYKSGPQQLSKYIKGVSGSKPGRNLGTFTTYYYSGGFYEVEIQSTTNDGMIYYSYDYCWRINVTILLAVTSVVLICTGVGAGAFGIAAAGAVMVH